MIDHLDVDSFIYFMNSKVLGTRSKTDTGAAFIELRIPVEIIFSSKIFFIILCHVVCIWSDFRTIYKIIPYVLIFHLISYLLYLNI